MAQQVRVQLPEPPPGAVAVRLCWSTSRRFEAFAVLDLDHDPLDLVMEEPSWIVGGPGRGAHLVATWLDSTGWSVAVDTLERSAP